MVMTFVTPGSKLGAEPAAPPAAPNEAKPASFPPSGSALRKVPNLELCRCEADASRKEACGSALPRASLRLVCFLPFAPFQ